MFRKKVLETFFMNRTEKNIPTNTTTVSSSQMIGKFLYYYYRFESGDDKSSLSKYCSIRKT